MAARMIDALAFAGIGTADQLKTALGARSVSDAIGDFAAATGLDPDGVSHVSALLLLLGLRDVSVIQDCFPQEVGDSGVVAALGLSGS
jgi:hypothetical protein